MKPSNLLTDLKKILIDRLGTLLTLQDNQENIALEFRDY